MILGFKQKFDNGEPTLFVEKIWKGFVDILNVNECPGEWDLRDESAIELFFKCIIKGCFLHKYFRTVKCKIHTIREDKTNRWRKDIPIHFYINVRQKNMFRFAPVIPCVSVQKIRILWEDESDPCVYLWNDDVGFMPFAYPGYNEEGLRQLVLNDGFDSIGAFFDWFDEDFTGKIIHWTSKRY